MQLNKQLSSHLNRHAPAVQRKMLTSRSPPWFADVCEELRAAKRQRRRAERRWLKSGLTIDKQIYIAPQRAVSKIVYEAKSKYLSSKITESDSCKQLYHVSNKLLGQANASPLPTVHPSDQLPDVFSEYFLNKVKLIHDYLVLQTAVSPFHDDSYTDAVFGAFQPVSEEHIRNVILKSALKTCLLDPIPKYLFIECLDELLPAVTHIINSSLVSGVVPPEFKIAIVKPFLKKPSLDHNNLKNYHPVSNLPFLIFLKKILLSQLFASLSSNNLF